MSTNHIITNNSTNNDPAMVKRGFGPTIMLLLLSVAATAVAVLYANQGGSNNDNARSIGASSLIATTSSGFTCPDADYYAFGDGYAAAFKYNPRNDGDHVVNAWSSPPGPRKGELNQLHFGVNIGSSGRPVFVVLSENTDKLYRFAPCEVDPFGNQPEDDGIDLVKKTGWANPVWAHYDTNSKLLYVAMFGRNTHTGVAVFHIASTAAHSWSYQSQLSGKCDECTHIHSVWGFKAGEILFVDVGAPWVKPSWAHPQPKGNGVFQLYNDGQVRQVSEDKMNARALASDPDGSHLYVVTQEDFSDKTKSTQTQVYQLERGNDHKLKTVDIVKLDEHVNSEGGAIVESLGEPGLVLVTDRTNNGGKGYVVDFTKKEGNPKRMMRLGDQLCANNPRYSVLLRDADGNVRKNPAYTLLTADDRDRTSPVKKMDFFPTGQTYPKYASWDGYTQYKNAADHIVQVRFH